MKKALISRTLDEANYLVDNKATVRQAAVKFGVSKSTVHTDMKEKLPLIDVCLYQKVKKLFDDNFSVKHIRGGESTKKKYNDICAK